MFLVFACGFSNISHFFFYFQFTSKRTMKLIPWNEGSEKGIEIKIFLNAVLLTGKLKQIFFQSKTSARIKTNKVKFQAKKN